MAMHWAVILRSQLPVQCGNGVGDGRDVALFGESKSVQVIALYSLRNVTCHVTSFSKVSRVLKEYALC